MTKGQQAPEQSFSPDVRARPVQLTSLYGVLARWPSPSGNPSLVHVSSSLYTIFEYSFCLTHDNLSSLFLRRTGNVQTG